jgi:hypothetical protein
VPAGARLCVLFFKTVLKKFLKAIFSKYIIASLLLFPLFPSGAVFLTLK